MLEQTTGKQIKWIGFNSWRRTYSVSDAHFYNYYGKVVSVIDKTYIDKINLDQKLPEVTTLPENAKLIFHPTSKFPRHKLEITTYKRKIKESLADYMVGNATKISLVQDPVYYTKAFETKDTIYCCHDDYKIEDIAKFLKYDVGDLKVISDYKLVRLTQESLLYLEYMEGKHTIPLITDKNLNKLVDSNNERISIDELDSIIELIKTNDSDNIALAAKIFTQFNASATPCLTKTFLMFYHEAIRQRSLAGTSVVYKNLITQFPPQPRTLYTIASLLRTTPPVDRDELEMVRKIIFPFIMEGINSKVEDRKDTFQGLGLKIRIEIDEA